MGVRLKLLKHTLFAPSGSTGVLKTLLTGLALVLTLVLAGCAAHAPGGGEAEMVRVAEGPFTMGFEIENDNEWGDVDEGPVHEVHLDAYWIDRHEVSAADFARYLNQQKETRRLIDLGSAVTIEKVDGRFQARPGLEDYPANRVSWYGADGYCRFTGKRLPTEAEWEKAARGTDRRIFPWGNAFPDNRRVTFRRHFKELGFQALEPVGSMAAGASPYGAHHMAGNVWEWVADWFDDDYYAHAPRENPKGPETGTTRVLRGGNWYYKAYYMRTTYRFNERPGKFNIWQGFRCARSDSP